MSSDIYKTSNIPTSRLTMIQQKEPPSVARTVDADRLVQILTSAESCNTGPLFNLYRDIVIGDSHIQGELAKRKLAVIGDPLSVQPWDKKSDAAKETASRVEKMLTNSPEFIRALAHLLDGVLWPVSVVEKVFASSESGGYEIADLVPVPHRLLDYKDGYLRILDTNDDGYVSHTAHDADESRYIIHRGHLLSVADYFGGPMRSIVWWWFLINQSRSWWARFLNRFGSGFLVGKYQSGDDESRRVLESAIKFAVTLGGLVVTKEAEVEIKESMKSDGDAYDKFKTAGQREISRLILGQTLSAEASPTGMNSGVSKMQDGVRRDIRRLDGILLGHTVRLHLVKQWMQINNIPGEAPIIIWSEDTTEEVAALGTLIKNLYDAGIETEDDALYTIGEKLGFPVRRRPPQSPSAFPFGASPLNIYSAGHIAPGLVSSDTASRGASADIAQAIREHFAPYRRIILESRSPDECLRRLEAYFADKLEVDRSADLIDHALTTFAANAVQSLPDPDPGGE